MDTGSPVIDDYDAKMPFKFTGTLDRVEIKLGENKLTAAEKGELERLCSLDIHFKEVTNRFKAVGL